ncbi:hypothetical protein HYH02_010945 [Chlamydomonas schloesseri]|uniref:Peptidase M11 gametolysin domain-containing protein n=1 Tax=Chlamydomonas schloesseri TaxID=2026947 RepID=A0A835TH93_9CHLO|nr:hypothetical protein HYH02_010945 [Chlamydomonas schloesseri]|eukprot:KAG2438246.1 hypothetical protein HYH02_010945 [Chlamydomonas schloesseri]
MMWIVSSLLSACAVIAALQGSIVAAQSGEKLVPVTVVVKGQVVAFTSHNSPQRANDPALLKLLASQAPASGGGGSRTAHPPPRRRAPPASGLRVSRGLAAAAGGGAASDEGGALPKGVLPPAKKQIRLEDSGNATFRAYAKVDLGQQAQFVRTGDNVEAPLTFQLDPAVAEELGFTDSGNGSSSGRRRVLTEAQHAMRRAILAVNNTRRSLQELAELGVLSKLKGGSGSRVPTAVAAGKAKVKFTQAPKDLMYTGKPLNVSSLTFLLSAPKCGLVPALNTSTIRSVWVPTGAAAGTYGAASATLQYMHKTCSFNKLRVYDNDDNQVVGPIDVGPCAGVTQYGDEFNFATSCSDPELDAMYDAVTRWVQQNKPEWITTGYFDTFRRKIMMLPLASCGSVFGYGSVGCPGDGSPCRTWLFPNKAETKLDASTIFHEMGHNQGVSHSAGQFKYGPRIITDEYADPVDPMGSAGPMTCYSAPNVRSYKAGWSEPLCPDGVCDDPSKGIKMGALVDGWNDFLIPAAALEVKNLLRIAVDQTGIDEEAARYGQERALFVSYRVAQPDFGYDFGIAGRDGGQWNRRIWVHEFNDTATGETATVDYSLMKAMLDVPAGAAVDAGRALPNALPPGPRVPSATWAVQGTNWTYNSTNFAEYGNLRIRVYSKNATAAYVGVCRFKTAVEDPNDETACYDAIDNDCDGLADAEDPDCNPPDASPPPPPRKRPPPPVKKPSSSSGSSKGRRLAA